jgi:uncharacterized membrane protein YjgN (DUF898 family)
MTVTDAGASAPAMPAPPAPVSAVLAVRFVGDTDAYWRLLIRGEALLAVTLGIYRFWFTTDMRRFLWSNTEIAGETMEYTGTPYELLIGFLIAIAVLVPIYIGFFVAALSLGLVGQIISTLSFPLLFFLGQFAVYRARRYRLTRTVYRGVRCHQGGPASLYAVYAVFWGALIVLTLGLAYPFAQSRLERFKMRHTYYGNLQGRFEGSGLRLFARGLLMWLMVIGPLAFAIGYSIATVEWDKVAAAAAKAADRAKFLEQIGTAFPTVYTAIVVLISAAVISTILAMVLYPVFQAMVLRWWIGGLRLGTLTVRSDLHTGPIYRSYLRFIGYGLVFSIIAGILGGMAVFTGDQVLGAMKLTAASGILKAVIGIVSYVTIMLGYSAIYQGTVKLTYWRAGMESIALEGIDALDGVKAGGAPSSAVGEGLADALNMGGF